MKRIFIISAVALLVIGAVAGGYLWWQQRDTTPAPEPSPPGPGAPPPATDRGNSSLKAQGGPALAGYYHKSGAIVGLGTNGQVVSIKDGGVTTLNSATFNEVILDMRPSSDGRYLLEKWGSWQSPRFSVYDTQNNSWISFGNIAFAAMDWSPSETKLGYLEKVNGGVNLGIMDMAKREDDGFARTTIASLAVQDADLAWLTPETIVLGEKPGARVAGSVWKFNVDTRRLLPLALNRNGLWIAWDKASGYGVQFDREPQNRLLLVDADGNTALAPLFVTMPDKCTQSDTMLYCAVPQEELAGRELPDDYFKRKFYTNDVVYRVNRESGATTLFIPESPLDATGLSVNENSLYFINRYDSKLYSITL